MLPTGGTCTWAAGLSSNSFLRSGSVTEFDYARRLEHAFLEGGISELGELDAADNLMASDQAVVFIDNHDTQRGHSGEGLNYTAGDRYALANVFMLAWPYGYPKIMSSYEFEEKDQGAPTHDPVSTGVDGCNDGWVCEHRWPAIAAMVKFRNATDGEPVANWQAHGGGVISFGRGDVGHVVINASEAPIDVQVQTDLPAGDYSNLLAGEGGSSVEVGDDGTFGATVNAAGAIAILDR